MYTACRREDTCRTQPPQVDGAPTVPYVIPSISGPHALIVHDLERPVHMPREKKNSPLSTPITTLRQPDLASYRSSMMHGEHAKHGSYPLAAASFCY